MSRDNNSLETVNAAAAAIVSAESRVQQVTVPRRRWASCFSLYWCFGSQRNGKRFSHAVLVPEPSVATLNASGPENHDHSPAPRLPFVAPPSSPASFLQSRSPSVTQSPTGPLSLSTLSASSFSPGGPASIFAIGPYANETQLVSPPVFSTFTTEPSTAPFTPPPEPVQLTTPSSPEVPFARLLISSLGANVKSEIYEFQSYHLYPGSPIGNLISPSSVCSGTSSPFPDIELHCSDGVSFLSFPVGEPPKILSVEGIAGRLVPRHARNGGSLLDGQISAAAPTGRTVVPSQTNEHSAVNRVSFELTAEEVARCLDKKTAISNGSINETNASNCDTFGINWNYHDLPDKLQSPVANSTVKEFKFDNADGAPMEPTVASDWWVKEKANSVTEHHKNWAFFPMIQPGLS